MLKSGLMTPTLAGWVEKFIHPALIKKALFKLPFDQLEKGSLSIRILDESARFEGKQAGHHAELIIEHPFRAYWLLKTQGELGFAQAFYEGAIQTLDLLALLRLGHDNAEVLQSLLGNTQMNRWQLLKHRWSHNSVSNSRRNISFHYDLGNEFYKLWLDESMTYSSGLCVDKSVPLKESQRLKYQRILDELELQGNESILEVGCGWGGFMQAATEQGAKVKGLTLSEEQQKYAFNRLAPLCSPRQFHVALQDYRHELGQYDHIVSIEMFEAVGQAYWDEYFAMLKRSLKPGGKAVLQIITIDEKHAETYQESVDFIQAYIFPGGLLPSVTQLQTLASEHGFNCDQPFEFGQDYADTCQRWKESFNAQSQALENMGYDAAFQRLWNYYLDYCTVGFESGHISVHQLTLSHSGVNHD